MSYNNSEIYKYVSPNLGYKDKLISLPSLEFVKSYIEIDLIKRTPDNKELYIKTVNGEEIIITDEYKLRENDMRADIKSMFNTLTKSIDFNVRVNLYKVDDYAIFFLEDENKDKLIKEGLNLYNKMLNITENLFPVNFDGEITNNSLEKILPYIKLKDMEMYDKLKKISEDPKELQRLYSLNKFAKLNINGVTYVGKDITKYGK